MAISAGLLGVVKRARSIVLRNRRAIRDALVVIGIGRAIWYYAVQGIHPWEWPGIDARAYWSVDLAHLYAASAVGEQSTYLYSPAFAQLVTPLSILPWPVFLTVWTSMLVAVLAWLVRPWPWALGILALPVSYELFVGQIHLLLATAIVLGFSRPGLWAFGILTKITPGIGLAWFAVRREWHALAIALGATLIVAAFSIVLSPGAWADWIAFLTTSQGRSQLLLLRLALGLMLVAAGALTGRAWLVPVAVWISLPVVWVESWVVLLAIIRLNEIPDSGPAAGDAASASAFLRPTFRDASHGRY